MANILVFGDSIAFGFYDGEGGWVDRLKRSLLEYSIEESLEHDPKVYNLAISGDTTKEIREYFEACVKARHWESQETVIIFAFGVNDSIVINGKQKVPQEDFKKNVLWLIETARKYTDKILFIGPLPVEEEKVTPMPWSKTESCINEKIKEYSNILEDICSKEKLQFIEMYKTWKKLNYQKLLYDGIHPNSKGHEVLFNTIRKYLEKHWMKKDN